MRLIRLPVHEFSGAGFPQGGAPGFDVLFYSE